MRERIIPKCVGTMSCCWRSRPARRLRPRTVRPVKSLLEMRHDNVVVQEWDLSCGAAALATILNYQYDDPVSEREIAEG